ncbi:MAG: hemolysin family protein [Planctomycetota bacterium]
MVSVVVLAVTPGGFFSLAFASLVISFVYALFENALLHYSSVKLMAEAKARGREEQFTEALSDEDDLLLGSKIGRGITQILAVVCFVAGLMEAQLSSAAAAAWATVGIILFLVLLVAAPYLIARRAGHVVLLRGLNTYRWIVRPLYPFSALLSLLGNKLMANGNMPDRMEEITDEILSAVEEGDREGLIEESERQMIEGVIDLREVAVDHIMTPRTEMISVPVEGTVEAAVALSTDHGISRLPVYRGTPDSIVGVLYVKDLLPFIVSDESPPSLGKLMRPPFFVPETKNVGELLNEMKARHVHMSIVLDEYGGTAGVATIEDILEEIVGEIQDEHEPEDAEDVVAIHENAATVEGRTHIDDLNEAMSIQIPESEEYETVGGLLFSRMGRVPAVGDNLHVDGVKFTVLAADARRVARVKVTVQR